MIYACVAVRESVLPEQKDVDKELEAAIKGGEGGGGTSGP